MSHTYHPILSPPMAELPRLHACIPASELNEHLRKLATLTTAYIHPKVISFRSVKNRRNWQKAMPDTSVAGRGLYSNFWRQAPGAVNRVAFFSTSTATYVGKSSVDGGKWHAWGAALLNNSQGVGGKILIIYNSDAHSVDPSLRFKSLMMTPMSNLIKDAHQEYAICSVWYGCGHYPAPVGQDLCVEYTMSWLQNIVTQLEGPFSGSSDPRVQNFTQISKK